MVKTLTLTTFIFGLPLLILLTGCTSIDELKDLAKEGETGDKEIVQVSLQQPKLNAREYRYKGQEVMIPANNSVSFHNIVNVPWNRKTGIPELLVGTPQTSIITNKTPRKMRAPVNIRITPWGGIDILAYKPDYNQEVDTRLYRFSPQGKLVSTVEINPPQGENNGWRILDFIIDENGYIYLIENYRKDSVTQNYLRKLTPQGQPIWTRSGAFNSQKLDINKLEGDFRQLLIDENSVPYLAATRHRGLVARINSENGSLEPYADWGEWTGEVFMDGKSKIYYVSYRPQRKTRCWTNYDPTLKKETLVNCDRNLYGLLAIPIGVDNQGRGYAVSGMSIGAIGNNSLVWHKKIDNIVLQEDKSTIYTSNFNALNNGGEIDVYQWENNSQSTKEIKLKIPKNVMQQGRGGGRLVYLDAEGNYYVYAGETPTVDGTLIVYSPEGVIKEQQKPAPDIHLMEYRLQRGRSWGVDLEGNIYLPLLGSTGLHVIKLNPQ